MMNQSQVPGLKQLADALSAVLPDDGTPKYLSLAALEVVGSLEWGLNEGQLKSGIDCANRYWMGRGDDRERSELRTEIVLSAEKLRKQGMHFSSPKWCRHALVMSALDTLTPSNGFAADHLLEISLTAGAQLGDIEKAMRMCVPGLSEALDRTS